jgi:exosortase E/protease (VPEID-CTERM system)
MTQVESLKMPRRAIWIWILFAAELVAIVVAFQVLASVECRLTSLESACRGLRGAVVRVMCLGCMLGIYLWARGSARQDFATMAAEREGGRIWMLVHGLGLVLAFLPLFVVPQTEMNVAFGVVFPVLVGAGAMAAIGGLFWLARPGAWGAWLRPRWRELLALSGVALILPDIADLIAPLWYWQVLTEITFIGVAVLLTLLSGVPVINPEAQIIGTNDFFVAVADSCSGIEGLALITAFLALYALLFRDTIRMGRFWLVVWPVSIFLSWLLNVVRITVLILIGAHVSPDLAVNGFHSFAGWLFFSALAIGVLIVVSKARWLHKTARVTATVPLSQDDIAARILPFVVFMFSGIVVNAFWQAPALGYPLQVLGMAGALWYVRRPLAAYLERPTGLAVLAGLAVGVLWVLSAPESEGPSAAIAALPPLAFAVWAALRILGTVALVPLIEELFFRGYLQARIDDGTWPRRILAIAVSAGAFALLHGRWLEAGIAGVIFSLLYIRQGRLADAITAHAVANALIAMVAAWRGDWALI